MNKLIRYFYYDPLYRSSFYLILDNIANTAFGFFFWLVSARLFTSEEIGFATTIISVIGIITSFSLLGLDTAILRYLPKSNDKTRLIGSTINLIVLVSIIGALIFLFLTPFISPKLTFILESNKSILMFIAFTLLWALFTYVDCVLIALRKSGIILIKSTIFGFFKILILIFLTVFGVFGILGSYYIAALIGFLFSSLYFRYRFIIDFSLIKRMFNFSTANYIAGIFWMIPRMVLPIIITNIIGPESTAYFYVTLMIAGLLFVVPGAVSQSLLTEVSYDRKDLDKKVKKAYLFNFLILTPAIILIIVFGKAALSLFNPEYVKAYPLLVSFSISGFFVIINKIYGTIWNTKNLIGNIIAQNFIKSILIVIPAIMFLPNGTLLTVSIIWLVSEIFTAFFSVLMGQGK